MRRLITLMIFTTISLIGMESSEDSRSSPPLPQTPSSSPLRLPATQGAADEQEEKETDMEELTRKALSIFFEDESGSVHAQSFSYELSRRIQPHVIQRNGNLRRLIHQRSQDLSDSQDRPRTPEQSLRKELRDIVIPTLTELFNEKEKEHTQDRKRLTDERLKFRLALITAGTTLGTTAAATIAAIVIALNT